MRVIVDAMGGDHAPKEIVAGAVRAAANFKVKVVLTGPEEKLASELVNHGKVSGVEIVHAPEVIDAGESPVAAVRRKRNSSLVKGITLLKDGAGDALVSAGNTGALMAASLLFLGKAEGISRPALGAMFPTKNGGGTLLLDVGANMDARPEQLYQYAVLGCVYLEEVLGRKRPRVGILNIGAEESKGNELAKGTYPLLRDSHLNFVGNVEARDLLTGVAEVVVCDGFVGNVALKLTEGAVKTLLTMLKKELMAGLFTKLGAMLSRPAFNRLRNSFDYSAYGGTPLLGINGAVVKCHGSSKSEAIFNGVRVAMACAEHRFWEKFRDSGMLDGADQLKEGGG